MEDTIAAITTAYGEAAVGIVRISGPQAVKIADRVLKGRDESKQSVRHWPSHTLHLATVQDPQTKEAIDEVLVAVMWGPHSYTGEDVIEFQGHGGRLILREVLEAVLRAGARLAEPGEFTRRAFMNGRMDLAQAEAVIDLIRARSEAARRLAMRQLEGRLSGRIKQIKEMLIDIAASLEAVLDFPEEGIEAETDSADKMRIVIQELEKILEGARGSRAAREGIRVVIIGKPNVGKSSLWNELIGEDRAIVTEIAGTTRDVIEEEVVVRGVPIRLVDTAGIRETADLVERIGVAKAREMLQRGQVVLVVFDAGEGIGVDDQKVVELVSGMPLLVIVNKSDLAEQKIDSATINHLFPHETVIWASMKEKWGIEEIKEAILSKVVGNTSDQGEEWLIGSVRQEEALNRCLRACRASLMAMEEQLPSEFVLIDLNEALESLGEITGESISDQVLDRIFSEFCIGK
ncbi:MAG: tRNA uridine-5-carboxymethylaminomethyl(34) synthesis GTPase MnmE [Syntrophomonadaceae bacterium]|nr:tRNA uridine-5-carboxymethylaminomethyl(34) synthesis GTPase MnmE [Syntrophomonadaceae bacterium]